MSRDDTRRYVIAYDIPDDGRRARLARLLLSYGDRLQYSVFVTDLIPARLVRLRGEVSNLILRNEDSVLVCDLGPTRSLTVDQFSYIGLERPITPGDFIIA